LPEGAPIISEINRYSYLLYDALKTEGKPADNNKYLVTDMFKDGSVIFRRSIFRTMKKKALENPKLVNQVVQS
jgi:hypothetical protein